MGKIDVLVEVERRVDEAFGHFSMALESEMDSLNLAESLVPDFAGLGLEVQGDIPPVPMFSKKVVSDKEIGFANFSTMEMSADVPSQSFVIACEVERAKLEELSARPDVRVWPNSPLALFEGCQHCGGGASAAGVHAVAHPFDLALSSGGVDCRPFRSAVSVEVIRTLLGVERIWFDGFKGQNIVVGIIDNGINGEVYPVVGGFTRPDTPLPGGAPIDSHGSMCAADVLVAAPSVKLYDYPFIGSPKSGGALAMFQEVLNQRRLDGTPHITSNSYGFYGRPSQVVYPNHEVWDVNHPLHRKVQEVNASGCPVFFAAGNCGGECPSTKCHTSGIGAGNSIHASSSIKEVITVAAVNSQHQRIGYSSQGPGGFEPRKPDISAYSHFFGNFGPGRPAGGDESRFDNGTSASTPVAAGVGALLMSAFPGLSPDRMKKALVAGAANIGAPGWDTDTGWGVINAAASYLKLKNKEV